MLIPRTWKIILSQIFDIIAITDKMGRILGNLG